MKFLVQVVDRAKVLINGAQEENIDRGMLVFVGFTQGDDKQVINSMVEKLFKLRIFSDGSKTNLSLNDVNGQLMCISQFTLYADTSKGNRPSFIKCLNSEEAKVLYDYFVECVLKMEPKAKFGKFHADMKVSLVNDGPFTLMIDSGEKNV